MEKTIEFRTVKLLSGERVNDHSVVNATVEVMEYYRDSSGFWRIKNFRRRRRARI
jgi:hypothetical protein